MPKEPRVANLDEVTITRKGGTATIAFDDASVPTMLLEIGDELTILTDQEVLDRYNETVRAMQRMAANYEHLAVEVPPGRPQIRYSAITDQWVPRGDVLRCVISDGGPNLQATVKIDDRELSLEEFGRLLTTHAGWGMRVAFVPRDRTDVEPDIEVRDPEERDWE